MTSWENLAMPSGSLSERLSERLIRMITDGELEPGAKLPNERELAESVGISRTSVREALRDLELRGLISRKPGRGTIVEAQTRPELHAGMLGVMDSSHRALREVMDLRAVIEPPIAARAAGRALEGELVTLLRPVELAERELRQPEPSVELLIRLDVEFHVVIAQLTHNPMLSRLMDITNEWMAPSRQSALQTTTRIERSVAAHRRIYEAIRAHDPAGAGAAMTGHIQEIVDNIGVGRWTADIP
ncbi:FadR/GntR family transcriptional regulator [Rhodococcus sp. T2V]|uniref:FadR/GntR family transcriptional regulator n=1 Tax=Rhodococcus sp. T2V TaxID=3034164 RepID=UPI0023E0F09A|nr:FadR/GntR family transcriptional regulator [Rhodococcus sp. T2V]MDF3306827.1 FadR/GntR family transcriptional regulator [Rhodococcus sp. T2V]